MNTDWSLYNTQELRDQRIIESKRVERLRMLAKAERIEPQTYWDARSMLDTIDQEIARRPDRYEPLESVGPF